MIRPRTALVTGAASGIGLAIARRLVGRGIRVLVSDEASFITGTVLDVKGGSNMN